MPLTKRQTPHAYMMRSPSSVAPSLPPSSRRQSHVPPVMTPMQNPQPLPQSMQNPHPTPRSRPTSNFVPMPNSHPEPSHRQEANPYPSQTHQAVPSATPLPEPKPTIQQDRRIPPNREIRRPPPVQENTSNFQIGLAMLEDEPPVTPRVYLQDSSGGEEEFNPYDPAHLEGDHRQTPSPLAHPHPARSREQAPPDSHKLRRKSGSPAKKPELTSTRTDMPAHLRSSPPPYQSPVSSEDHHEHTRPNHVLPAHVQRPQDQSQSSSRNSSPGRDLPGPHERLSSEIHRTRGGNIPAVAEQTYIPPPPVVQQYQNPAPAVVAPPRPASPPRMISERISPPAPSQYSSDRDGRSTHQSISTHSSGQTRSSRPPPSNRHVPKRLVMPAPLNTGGVPPSAPSSGYLSPPTTNAYLPPPRLAQTPQQMNFPPPRQMYPRKAYPAPRNLPPPRLLAQNYGPPSAMPPVQAIVKAQEIQLGKGGKLKKRASMLSSIPSSKSPSPPVFTTVSFAPPIIGFNHSIADEKIIARSKTEKIVSKRLSKRRTNL